MSRISGDNLTAYPLKNIPIALWDQFGEKCQKTGTNRRWVILMLISKFCGGTLHLENPPAPKPPRKPRQRKVKTVAAEAEPHVEPMKPPAREVSDTPDLGNAW
jgi:hypothetical protein